MAALVTKSDIIAELEAENDSLKAQLAAYEAGLSALQSYLQSSKFSVDTSVQTSDVLAAITSARSAAADEQFVPRGLASAIKREHPWSAGMTPDGSRTVRYAR